MRKRILGVAGVFLAAVFGLYYYTRPKPIDGDLILSDGTVLKLPPLPKFEKAKDEWIKDPPVFCPTGKTCKVWHLDFDINEHLSVSSLGIVVMGVQCAPDPTGRKDRGRIIAVDPNDYHIAFVSLHDGC